MANLGTTFDATSIEPAKPLEVLPPGKYAVQIVNSEMRRHQGRHGPVPLARTRRAGGPLAGPQAVRPAQPGQCQPADRRDRAAHAVGDLPRHRAHAGAGQRGAAPDPVHRRRAGAAAEERLRREQQGALPAARARRRSRQRRSRRAPRRRRSRASPRPAAAAFTSAPWKRSGVRSAHSDTAAGTSPNMNGGGALPRISRRHPWTATIISRQLPATAQRGARPAGRDRRRHRRRSGRRSPPPICSARRSRKPIDPRLVPPRQDRAAPSAARARRAVRSTWPRCPSRRMR